MAEHAPYGRDASVHIETGPATPPTATALPTSPTSPSPRSHAHRRGVRQTGTIFSDNAFALDWTAAEKMASTGLVSFEQRPRHAGVDETPLVYPDPFPRADG